jgi:hypothetical protein
MAELLDHYLRATTNLSRNKHALEEKVYVRAEHPVIRVRLINNNARQLTGEACILEKAIVCLVEGGNPYPGLLERIAAGMRTHCTVDRPMPPLRRPNGPSDALSAERDIAAVGAITVDSKTLLVGQFGEPRRLAPHQSLVGKQRRAVASLSSSN